MEPYNVIVNLPNWVRWILVIFISPVSLFVAHMILQVILNLNFLWMPDTVLYFIPTEYFFYFEKNIINAFLVGATPIIIGATLAPAYKIITSIIIAVLFLIVLLLAMINFYSAGDLKNIINIFSTILGSTWAIYYSYNKLKIFKIKN